MNDCRFDVSPVNSPDPDPEIKLWISGVTTYRNGPERTETDRSGPKRTYENSEADFYGYRK